MCLEQAKLVPFPQSTETRKKSKPSLALIDMFTVNSQLLSLKVIQMKIQGCI